MKLRNRLSKVVSYIVQGLVVLICLDMISVESLVLNSFSKDISIGLDSRDN